MSRQTPFPLPALPSASECHHFVTFEPLFPWRAERAQVISAARRGAARSRPGPGPARGARLGSPSLRVRPAPQTTPEAGTSSTCAAGRSST